MITVPKEQAQNRFALLPTTLQDAVFSEENTEIISAIGEQYSVSDEDLEKISSLVGWVLLGFLKIEDLPKEIATSTNLSPQIIKGVTDSFKEKIFNSIKPEIEKVYAPLLQEETTGNSPKIIQDIDISRRQPTNPAPLPINKMATPAAVATGIAASSTAPNTSDIGWSRPKAGPDPVVRLSIPQGPQMATAVRPAMTYPAQQAPTRPIAPPAQTLARLSEPSTTTVTPVSPVRPQTPSAPIQNSTTTIIKPIATGPTASSGGEFARLSISPLRSPLTGPAPAGAHPTINIPPASPLPTGTPPTKTSGFISASAPAAKPAPVATQTPARTQAPNLAQAPITTPAIKPAAPAPTPISNPTFTPKSTPAPTPTPVGATIDPPPMMLHEDTTFKPAEKNVGFTLSKPGGGAQMDLDREKSKAVARPAVLEFGGAAPSPASKPPAFTSTPASNAQRYTEFRPSLSSVPTANSGPRNVSQILPPVPPPVIPVPMPPRPSASGIPVPRPPQSPQKPPQKDKVITKNFL